MKKLLTTLSLTALLVGTGPALANNSHVEAMLVSYGDTSMFYQALLNTGVLSELRQDQYYTVFAPTNEAFTAIQPQNYPCFYAVQCRPQIAALLRDHIIVGSHDLKDLVSYGQGLDTMGTHPVYVGQPYVGDYAVNGNTILSHAEINSSYVYRINGVIALPQDLVQFQQVNYVPETVTTRKVITTTTTAPAIVAPAYPAGTMMIAPAEPDSVTEHTTVIHTYTTEQ